jgi:Flp pilus assembly protein TadG
VVLRRRNQNGVAMVEFALLLPVIAIFTLGTVDMARGYVVYERVRNATREAAVYAGEHPGQLHDSSGTACANPANADYRGTQEASGQAVQFRYSTNLVTCNPPAASMPSGLAAGQPLTVVGTSTLKLLTPLVSKFLGNPVSISSSVCVNITGSPSTVSCP